MSRQSEADSPKSEIRVSLKAVEIHVSTRAREWPYAISETRDTSLRVGQCCDVPVKCEWYWIKRSENNHTVIVEIIMYFY